MANGKSKQELLNALLTVVQMTRAGADVKGLKLKDEETVEIVYAGGSHYANIAGDSGISIIRDICKNIS